MPELKSIGPFEIKSEVRGEISAVIATLGVVDKEADVLLPGCIVPGTRVKLSSFAHDVLLDGRAPAGIGTVSEQGRKAILTGRFFLGTQRGRESFETVRELGSDVEFSIGYQNVRTAQLTEEWRSKGAKRVIRGLDLVEASPVLLGASIGTGLLSAKTAPDPIDVAGQAEYTKFLDREARILGPYYPPPSDLLKFLAFAGHQLGIPSDQMPRIGMVKQFDGSPRKVGAYHPALHFVKLKSDLLSPDLQRVAAHELAHAAAMLDGRDDSELDAEMSAEYVLAEWRTYCRRDQ